MAAVIGSGMVLIDATAVNVALPFMQQELSATAQELQWIIESYTLFLSALILLGGALGDRYGRRKIFALGFAIFTAASLGCAIAPNIAALIGARCVQGVGAALATPGSLALISAAYSGKARGNAIGIWSAASGMAGAAAPFVWSQARDQLPCLFTCSDLGSVEPGMRRTLRDRRWRDHLQPGADPPRPVGYRFAGFPSLHRVPQL